MQFGRFRLGMRTIKSALAVFSLRQDLTTTVSFGKSRIIGNTL
ncbi:hypothetical protein BU183_05660, partial [Enterococcus faecium]